MSNSWADCQTVKGHALLGAAALFSCPANHLLWDLPLPSSSLLLLPGSTAPAGWHLISGYPFLWYPWHPLSPRLSGSFRSPHFTLIPPFPPHASCFFHPQCYPSIAHHCELAVTVCVCLSPPHMFCVTEYCLCLQVLNSTVYILCIIIIIIILLRKQISPMEINA